MDTGALGIVIGIAGVLITIGVALWQHWRRRTKWRLEWWFESTPMTNSSVSIRVRDVEVADPHLTRVEIRSAGWATIPQNNFDAGRALEFSVDQGGAVTLDNSHGEGQIAIDGGEGEGFEWATYRVQPQPIGAGARGYLTFVSAGPAHVSIRRPEPLIDAEVRKLDGPTEAALRATRKALRLLKIGLGTMVAALATLFAAVVALYELIGAS